MVFGVLGSGSWGTAITKILSGNGHITCWWVRNERSLQHIKAHCHNPQYLSAATLDTRKLYLSASAQEIISKSEIVIIAIPSAYVKEMLQGLPKDIFTGKKIISAVKGILPDENILLNEYLQTHFDFPLENYFTLLGPCHAEEIAAQKLSYLTITGIDREFAEQIALHFKNHFVNTITNEDVTGVQYAAVLKNIYALGAGIAHGLDYGDNFQSVLISNSADEMAGFLRKAGIFNAQIGWLDHEKIDHQKRNNYAASVYLGDLLVTCYSLHSRNRAFGTMIGKGYSVKAAQLEMNMVAEGYNASKCMHIINEKVQEPMPIAETVYGILWQKASPLESFKHLEKLLV